MVLTRKSKSNSPVCDTKAVLLQHIYPGNRLAIALSGGVDSVVLLHVLAELSKEMHFMLTAVHVNHGISDNASHWSRFCCDLCHTYQIPIHVAYVHVKKGIGLSLEASAREQRYRVFGYLQADFVVLAQHLDDQAETMLLQLFRGAGIKGLSAMPEVRNQQGHNSPKILRPLLEVSRSSIETYARQNELTWITDESNDDTTFNRNFLRHDVLPVIRKRYPRYPEILLRSSRHFSEANELLDELAQIDRDYCLVAGKLHIERLRAFSLPRAKNLLRYTLLSHGADLPSTARLNEILKQLQALSPDHQFHVSFGNTEIRSYQGAIYILSRPKGAAEFTEFRRLWHGEALPDVQHTQGAIRFIESKGLGISPRKILGKTIGIRLRKGGERFMPACNRPRRSLKNLLQEASIPPWERMRMPLLFCDERLVWVPGIGIDCEFQAESGELGILPVWNSSS
ncbi:tRNA lysidine(34) synthetase TilS [Nitrosomonas sp. JL21]|nr:tRNA lysidine(34) synthetase TilS [Nitrosomonas sp. JL21]MBL8497687.1 tRNA lysidine(34) synthetase TilS [Nitrosomonas sp.]MXS78369.1 tRNA lysidine(34) synthetase TilS [Nitrosomonas sp. JL21]